MEAVGSLREVAAEDAGAVSRAIAPAPAAVKGEAEVVVCEEEVGPKLRLAVSEARGSPCSWWEGE